MVKLIVATGLVALLQLATAPPVLAAPAARGVFLSSTGERALLVHGGEVLLLQLPARFGPGTTAQARVVQRIAAPGLAAEPALSPEGTAVALVSQRGSGSPLELEVRRIGQGRPTRTPLTAVVGGQSLHVAVSDDGQHVALTQRGRVHLAEAGKRTRLLYDTPGTVAVSSELVGRGNSLRLAVRVAEPTLLESQWTYFDLRELRGARPGHWKSPKGTTGRWPGISPRGDLVLQPTADGVEVYAPVADGKLALRIRLPDKQATGGRFSRDGRTALTYARPAASGSRQVLRFAVADASPRGATTVARADRSWQTLRDDGVLLVVQVQTPTVAGGQGEVQGCRAAPARGHCAVVHTEPGLSVELHALTFE